MKCGFDSGQTVRHLAPWTWLRCYFDEVDFFDILGNAGFAKRKVKGKKHGSLLSAVETADLDRLIQHISKICRLKNGWLDTHIWCRGKRQLHLL